MPAADDPEVSARLDAALAGEVPVAEVVIDVGCTSPEGWRSTTIRGSGLGYWGRDTQIRLTSDEIRLLLRDFRDADFVAMPPIFGVQREDPKRPTSPTGSTSGSRSDGQPPVLTCRVHLAIGDVNKEVRQLNRGEPSAALRSLADSILDAAEAAVADGVTVTDLQDGLDKTEAGLLEPRALRVTLQQGTPGERTVLRIKDGAVHLEASGRDDVSSPISPPRLQALAGALADSAFDSLPANVFGAGYTALTVAVIELDHTVVARPFQGMDPEANPTARQRFERAVTAVDELRDEIEDGADVDSQ